MTIEPKRADVAVVGGGAAGSICAALLARMGYDVVLIDHTIPRRAWPELLSPEATLFLWRIGFLEGTGSTQTVLNDCGVPCKGILDTWNRPSATYHDFQLTRCSLGWVVIREWFDAALQRFAEQQGARILRTNLPATLISLDQFSIELRVPVVDQPVCASFLIDGTGVASKLMPSTWRPRLRFDRLVAIRIPLAAQVGLQDSMLFASSSAGWWYVPCINGDSSLAIFLTDGDLIPKQTAALIHHLRMQFLEAFATLPEFDESGELSHLFMMRDARTTCRRRLWHGRWLPIGDAAYTLDPISGDGLARCFQMAEAASECVAEFLQTSSPGRIEHFATLNALAFAENLSRLRQVYSLGSRGNWDQPFWQRRANSDSLINLV